MASSLLLRRGREAGRRASNGIGAERSLIRRFFDTHSFFFSFALFRSFLPFHSLRLVVHRCLRIHPVTLSSLLSCLAFDDRYDIDSSADRLMKKTQSKRPDDRILDSLGLFIHQFFPSHSSLGLLANFDTVQIERFSSANSRST